MLLTAAATVFIPRYALPVDPVILLAGVIMADGVLTWARRAWQGSMKWRVSGVSKYLTPSTTEKSEYRSRLA
jgi:hypothetical protein